MAGNQYAWVGYLGTTSAVVQLFGFVERASIPGMSIDLGALEPLAVVSALPDQPSQPDNSNVWNGSTAAIVHVLARSP